MRTLATVIAASVMVAAAPTQTPPTGGKNIVIAVDKDENVTITLGGKPITCEELNAYYATKTTPPQRHAFDCRLLASKHKP